MRLARVFLAIIASLVLLYMFIALMARYPGITPSQTANIMLHDNKFGGRALKMASFWGDKLLPPLQQASFDYQKLDGNPEVLMIVLAEKIKTPESLSLAKKLYQRENIDAKVIGAAGLAANGLLPDDAFASGGYLYDALVYNPNTNAQNYKQLVDPTKPPLELALLVAKYAKRKEVLPPILKILSYRDIPYPIHANACDALAAIGDKDAIPELENAMKSDHFYALPNAFSALVALSDENAIPLAIARISPAIKGRNSQFVINELERVTGQHFGFDKNKWQSWWDTNNHLPTK